MALAFAVFPHRSSINRIAWVVFTANCLIEFSQIWKPGWLNRLRESFLGRTILGSDFSWWDFLAYVVGFLRGIVLLRRLYDLIPEGKSWSAIK